MNWLQRTLGWFLSRFYQVEVHGLQQLKELDENVIIVANHTSFLDALLLYCFIPVDMTFAVNTQVAKGLMIKVVNRLVHLFPMEPGNPLAVRTLIHKVRDGENVVIFPEGRITVTGSLMKIYHGPGLVAVRTNATVVPVCIDGAQYTPFSRMKGRIRTRWFPEISLTVLKPRKLEIPEEIRGRARRTRAGKILSDVMTEMVFASSPYRTTLFDRLLDARIVHGGKHIIGEDINRKPIDYNTVVTKCLALGKELTKHSAREEYVGVLLPGALSTLVTFWGLHAYGRVPAMLNYTVGAHGMISACETAKVKTVVTAHAFVIKAKLQDVVHDLSRQVNVIYLEDIAKNIALYTKIRSFIISKMDFGLKRRHRTRGVSPDSPAVVLFTSGSEGTPKGVLLSHKNLLANMSQMASRVDFNAQDIVLNALPMFHSFGLTAGTLLPVLSGMKTFLYPSPLHYRVIPEIAYEIGATILFGTNTFLAGYAKHAHPYDFYSVRYVFAGAEKLRSEVRRTWEDKFGVRIFEGYGATETSPVLAVNTPMDNKPGTVGRLLPALRYRLDPVQGLENGRRLFIQGPNVMLGYLLHDNPGVLQPLAEENGECWYDTGDIVELDDEGFVTISGRAKRFAKVAGEMVSLTAVESLASKVWPEAQHAAVAVLDERKGEQVVLMSTQENADRTALLYQAQQDGIGEINVPRKVMQVVAIPVLGTGKTDYVSAQSIVGST